MAAGAWDHTVALQNMWRGAKDKPIRNPYRKAVKEGIPIDVKDLKGVWEKFCG